MSILLDLFQKNWQDPSTFDYSLQLNCMYTFLAKFR
jgi:hypothetical protein